MLHLNVQEFKGRSTLGPIPVKTSALSAGVQVYSSASYSSPETSLFCVLRQRHLPAFLEKHVSALKKDKADYILFLLKRPKPTMH